jgi:hypothetical protein
LRERKRRYEQGKEEGWSFHGCFDATSERGIVPSPLS